MVWNYCMIRFIKKINSIAISFSGLLIMGASTPIIAYGDANVPLPDVKAFDISMIGQDKSKSDYLTGDFRFTGASPFSDGPLDTHGFPGYLKRWPSECQYICTLIKECAAWSGSPGQATCSFYDTVPSKVSLSIYRGDPKKAFDPTQLKVFHGTSGIIPERIASTKMSGLGKINKSTGPGGGQGSNNPNTTKSTNKSNMSPLNK